MRRVASRIFEDEGNGTMNEGNVAQSEGSDATPPPAKKARLLEGLRHDARSVERITGMRCAEVIEDEDQIECLELRWIEQADTLGTCAVCGSFVDEAGGCLKCQIVRLPEVPDREAAGCPDEEQPGAKKARYEEVRDTRYDVGGCSRCCWRYGCWQCRCVDESCS